MTEILEGKCRITRDKHGWRADAPNGDFSCQPSKDFAISWARRWTVSDNMRLGRITIRDVEDVK